MATRQKSAIFRLILTRLLKGGVSDSGESLLISELNSQTITSLPSVLLQLGPSHFVSFPIYRARDVYKHRIFAEFDKKCTGLESLTAPARQ